MTEGGEGAGVSSSRFETERLPRLWLPHFHSHACQRAERGAQALGKNKKIKNKTPSGRLLRSAFGENPLKATQGGRGMEPGSAFH